MVDGVKEWEFNRGLSCKFMAKLKALAEQPGWFKDVLRDSDLILGVRDEYLDVYYLGQRLFHVTRKRDDGELKVTTHPKYLINPDMKGEAELTGAGFEWGKRTIYARMYDDEHTLKKMKRAAAYYAKPEKEGVHAIVRANPGALDMEIAFGGPPPNVEPGAEEEPTPNRIDISCLESVGDKIFVRFWEAKRFVNKELFRPTTAPKIFSQIKSYRGYLKTYRKDIVSTYQKVARNLVEISGWNANRTVGDLVRQVAKDGQVCLDADPVVGLVVFDYDVTDKKSERFKGLVQKIEGKGWPVVTNGKAQEIRLVAGIVSPR